MRKLAIYGATLFLALGIGHYAKADDAAAPKADDKQVEKKAPEGDEKADKGETKEGAAATKSGASEITCKNGGDTRTLTKKDMEGGGCEVMYNKGGEDKSIAQAKNDLTYCDKTMDKVKDNLTKSGYTCQ